MCRLHHRSRQPEVQPLQQHRQQNRHDQWIGQDVAANVEQPVASTARLRPAERDDRQHVVEQRDHAHIHGPRRQTGIAIGVLHEGQPHDGHVRAKHPLHEHAPVAHVGHEAPGIQLGSQEEPKGRGQARRQHPRLFPVADGAAHQLGKQQARQRVVEDQPRRRGHEGRIDLPQAPQHHPEGQQQHAGQRDAHGKEDGIQQVVHQGSPALRSPPVSAAAGKA